MSENASTPQGAGRTCLKWTVAAKLRNVLRPAFLRLRETYLRSTHQEIHRAWVRNSMHHKTKPLLKQLLKHQLLLRQAGGSRRCHRNVIVIVIRPLRPPFDSVQRKSIRERHEIPTSVASRAILSGVRETVMPRAGPPRARRSPATPRTPALPARTRPIARSSTRQSRSPSSGRAQRHPQELGSAPPPRPMLEHPQRQDFLPLSSHLAPPPVQSSWFNRHQLQLIPTHPRPTPQSIPFRRPIAYFDHTSRAKGPRQRPFRPFPRPPVE